MRLVWEFPINILTKHNYYGKIIIVTLQKLLFKGDIYMNNQKKRVSTFIALCLMTLTLVPVSVSAISQSDFTKNKWNSMGTTAVSTYKPANGYNPGGLQGQHSTFCMQDGSSETYFHAKADGIFWRINTSHPDMKKTFGYTRVQWTDKNGAVKSDSQRQWCSTTYKFGYTSAIAKIAGTINYNIPSGYKVNTYHGFG